MKRLFLVAVILAIFLSIAGLVNIQPATAQAIPTPTPKSVYVDPERTEGNEDGTLNNPYNELEEGIAFAQAQPHGATLYRKNPTTDQWEEYDEYGPVTSGGGGGTPIPSLALYLFLAVFATVLILVGWRFLRQSRQFKD